MDFYDWQEKAIEETGLNNDSCPKCNSRYVKYAIRTDKSNIPNRLTDTVTAYCEDCKYEEKTKIMDSRKLVNRWYGTNFAQLSGNPG